MTKHFSVDAASWRRGVRGVRLNDPSRALAAYVARVRCGHRAVDVAEALGYRSASSVSHAVRRVADGLAEYKRTIEAVEREL